MPGRAGKRSIGESVGRGVESVSCSGGGNGGVGDGGAFDDYDEEEVIGAANLCTPCLERHQCSTSSELFSPLAVKFTSPFKDAARLTDAFRLPKRSLGEKII